MSARKKFKADPLFGERKPAVKNGVLIGKLLAPTDAVARSMELKWGVGRLVEIVPVDWAKRFGEAAQQLNDLLEDGDTEKIAAAADVVRRAWLKLDQVAVQAGQKPIEPVGWSFRVGNQPAVLARTEADAAAIRAIDSQANIWTLESVGNAIHALMVRDAPAIARNLRQASITRSH